MSQSGLVPLVRIVASSFRIGILLLLLLLLLLGTALACIHCISSFPARRCLKLEPTSHGAPNFHCDNQQAVAFTPRRLFTSLLSQKQPPPFSPFLFDFDQLRIILFTMASEQPADTPPAGGSLADRISKPEGSEPAGTFAV